MSGRRILVVLGHSLHVRNFVASGCLEALAHRGHELRVLMPGDLIDEVRAEGGPTGFTAMPLEPYLGGRARGEIRSVFRIASFVQRERFRTYRHKVRLGCAESWRYRVSVPLLRSLRDRRDLEALVAGIERRLPPRAAAQALVDEWRPDLVFCPTLIHDGSDVEVLKAARRRGVAIAAFAATWDTLTSKGCFLVRPDALLVWGDENRRHAVEHHGFAPDDVFATGAPHLDVYGPASPGEPRERFLAARNVDPATRVVLFAGTTLSKWEDEPRQLRALSEAVTGGELKDTTIWYRPHPRRAWRDVAALGDLPGVYVDDQVRRQKATASSSYSTRGEDLVHYRSLMDACEGVISAFSTMILEAAMLGKPSLVVAFGADDGAPRRLFQHTEYEHSVELLASPGITVCGSLEELKQGVQRLCGGEWASLHGTLRTHAGRIARNLDGGGRERIVHALDALACGRRP